MKILSYGLAAVAVLAMIAPALAFAESENEMGEAGYLQENHGTSATTQAEHGDNAGQPSGYGNSLDILFATVAALVFVVAYSGWKVYMAKRKSARRSLV